MKINNISDYEIFRVNEYESRYLNGIEYQVNKGLYLDIILTDYCNQNCGFCIADLLENKENCNIEIFKDQIRYAIEEIGVREVLIVGGEPTIAKSLLPILEFLEQFNLDKICMTTNGHRLIDGNLPIAEVLSVVTHLNLSLMSLNPEAQRTIGKTRNTISLDQLAFLYEKCKMYNTMFRVNNNVFRENNDTLNELLAFYEAVRNFCHTVKFSPLLKTDNFSVVNVVTEWVRQNILSDDEYESLFKQLEAHYSIYPIVRNPFNFGFVEYAMICLETPIIINYNHRGMMAKKASEGFVNNLKLLANGNLSLSWNKDFKDSVIRFGE